MPVLVARLKINYLSGRHDRAAFISIRGSIVKMMDSSEVDFTESTFSDFQFPASEVSTSLPNVSTDALCSEMSLGAPPDKGSVQIEYSLEEYPSKVLLGR